MNQMKRNYIAKKDIVMHYLPYTQFSENDPDDVEFTVDFSLYNPEFEKYLKKIKDIFENIDDHDGSLFYIITSELEYLESGTMDYYANRAIGYEFEYMHYLQSLIESSDETLDNLELVIRDKSDNAPKHPKVISSNSYINRLFIENLLKTYKVHFTNEFQRLNSNATSYIDNNENIKADDLLEMADLLKNERFRKGKLEKGIEKEMIRLMYVFLVDNAKPQLTEQFRSKATAKIFEIVKYLLIIFNIIDDESTKVSNIRKTYNNYLVELKPPAS